MIKFIPKKCAFSLLLMFTIVVILGFQLYRIPVIRSVFSVLFKDNTPDLTVIPRPNSVSMQPGSHIGSTVLWRGMMLDTARHFYSVREVKHLIDLMAQYKLNRLHLHLTDDQGWRIEIKSWPLLTQIGGSTSVDGLGGFYTQEDFAELVDYAESRYITIIPEIEMPGHCNAALASYA